MSPILTLPALAGILTLFSLFLYRVYKRPQMAVVCLFAAAFLLRWWMAGIDPFLHDWDERFHALVARNMLHDPLRPVLIAHPRPDYDYRLWCCNHIWLHKPPLFLWQMALSMKLFGIHLWSMRLPSILMGALLVFPLFRMGKLLKSPDMGYYGAVLYTYAYNQLEMISGNEGMDHNDVAFMFYVTLSLWAWFEWVQSGEQIRWAVWVGIFAGAAVLCKWMAGLLVYGVWSIDILFASHPLRIKRLYRSESGCCKLLRPISIHRVARSHPVDKVRNSIFANHFLPAIKPILVSIGTTVAIFLPWQLYMFREFPAEAAYEQAYNFRHIVEVVEQHRGTWSYYFEISAIQYGYGGWVLAIAGILWMTKAPLASRLRNALLLTVVIVYGFFSFVAVTKMPNFVYFIAPIIFLLCGYTMVALDKILNSSLPKPGGSVVFLTLVCLGCCLMLAPDRIAERHFNLTANDEAIRRRKLNNTRIYQQLNQWTPAGCTIYNCIGELEAMFFSDRTVYGMAPAFDEFKTMKKNDACIAIFDDPDDLGVPGFILDDSAGVIFLKEKLIRDK